MTVMNARETAFNMYVEERALNEGRPEAAIRAEISPDDLFDKLLALHTAYMAAQCSFGYMAESLNLTYEGLTNILNTLGLRATQGQ